MLASTLAMGHAFADEPAGADTVAVQKDPVKGKVGDQVKGADAKDEKGPYAEALFKLIENSQNAIHDAMAPVETELANTVEQASKSLLADQDIYKALLKMAIYRDKLNDEEANPERASRAAMGSLQSLLRQAPGVMNNEALINRAKLIAQVATYYGKHDPSMCRYLPQDYSTLLVVDAPWLTDVDEDLVTQAIVDETKAVKTILVGVPPLVINDVDVQKVFSKFAGEWLGSLDQENVRKVAEARAQGNYCPLWATMLTDISRMSEPYPSSIQKILLPMLTMPTRGWLDVGLWAYRPGGGPAADGADVVNEEQDAGN
ncbi:hypothetical protein [Pseudomonas taiwanensis]|uniref:hypothetical protein n=1 Tax=Pseudomonas taiwanensis TaxID=470150 RepID=UPI0028EB60CC|nr:hypothetical protein [Pseudomonas taiwanensis]